MGLTGKQEQTSVDAWIVQKLKHEWSSCEFGGMLTKEKLSDAVLGFRHLDTPIKVRPPLLFYTRYCVMRCLFASTVDVNVYCHFERCASC